MRPYSRKNFIRLRLLSLGLSLSILIAIAFFLFGGGSNQVPNFHGWTVPDVLEFVGNHENLRVSFELVYSEDMMPARVVGQSYGPGTTMTEGMQVIIEISKGIEVP